MPNWNPKAPDVLGLEWLLNHDRKGRVWAGAPARMQRLESTVSETIGSLKMSAAVDPLSRDSIPTVIDVIEEGDEFIPLMKTTRLLPNADKTNEGWVTQAGGSTNLFQSIDQDTSRWPNKAIEGTWIRTGGPQLAYACSVNAALFAAAGAAQNGRIGWVGVGAVMGANTGFRRVGVALEIGGVLYPPAAGGIRDVHVFGATYDFWWGELNPSTSRPWTPADIADFGSAGTSRIFIRSQDAATPTHYPKVLALSLNVAYAEVENRVAVGVWRRPNDIGTDRLIAVTTDALRTMPGGTANWSKLSGRNYLFYWRQTVSPSEYGAVVAADVQWNGGFQDLGPGGQPANRSYPPGELTADLIAHDHFGRPQEAFDETYSHAAMGLVLRTTAPATSVDSQPYRADIADLVSFRSGSGILAQRMTPGSSQSYLGVRLAVIPPASPGAATLTITVHRVSDGVQMGGSFAITAEAVRALPHTVGGWRYIHGVLSSAASLVSGTQYEVRLASDGGGVGGDYIVAVPDASLGPEASFGGTTSGAVIAGVHQTSRDLPVNLLRQPDPPTAVTAAITDVAIDHGDYLDIPTVEHVLVSWTAPAVGLGASFARYELERQHDGGVWERVKNITSSATTSFVDHEAPRQTVVGYRIRAIATDGRFSAWAASGTVTPEAPGAIVILTSNHAPDLEVVYIYDPESTYPILSTARDETKAIHGSDLQVVFMEAESRGIGWRTRITVNQRVLVGKGSEYVLMPLIDLIRSMDVPYVCVLDDQGMRKLGHVRVEEVSQTQPQHLYAAQIDVIPTHTEPVPVEGA